VKRSHLTRTALALLLVALLVGCQDLNARQPEGETSLAAAALVRRDLVTGATLNGANGMYFGPDGNLYVAVFARGDHLEVSSLFGATVQVWDPSTEAVLEQYDFPAPVNAIRFRGDLVVPDLAVCGKEAVSTVPVAFGLAQPEGMAVGPSGAIYVSENGRNVLTRIWPR